MPQDLQVIKKIGTIADKHRNVKVVIGRGCRGALYRLSPLSGTSSGRLEAPVSLRSPREKHLAAAARAICGRKSKPCAYRCTDAVRARLAGF